MFNAQLSCSWCTFFWHDIVYNIGSAHIARAHSMMFMTLSCGTTITIYSYPRSFYYTTFADLLDKHRFSLSNDSAYSQPQNEQLMILTCLVPHHFDVASPLTSFGMSWGLSTRYGSGANEYHESQFRTTQTLRPFAGNGADAKRLLARVQGMLGLARKDTSSGIVFIIFILCSVTITTQNYDT